MHTSRLKCANQDNFFVVQPMWSHRALQSEGPPLSSMIYCHDLKCLILLNRCTHMCYLSHSVSLFPAFLSSHWKFPQSSAVSLVRMKTAYCRRRGCLYRLYLESCLISDSKVSVYNAGHPGSIPGSGRSPGEGNGTPLQYSSLENPMGREAW